MSIRSNNQAKDRYIAERLTRSNGRDDRCDKSKMWADAELRGKIGSHNANRVIAKIDEIKSWR